MKIKTLQENLKSNQRAITTCLYQRYVPPTNNGTEQSVRKMKIKMKVAGCFRSEKGAEAYAVIQSIIDTAIKQNIKPLLAIQNPDIICTQIAE
ncbi:MAG: transposase [Saprospiraceae bacterium]|nr:transposase [Saprospiraceae bacterium]